MKKIMIVPGTEAVIPAIQAARDLGLYVITADNKPENIGHQYADEYVNVNLLDKEALLEQARLHEIDGIITFACDLAAVPVAYVAEKMGLPSAGPYESVCILQDKGKFRRFLKEHGFNTPWARSYNDLDQALSEADEFPYPVIVKPVDSCGSQGVSIARVKGELRREILLALDHSFSGQFIVEKYLETVGFISDSDCFVANGKFRLFSFSSEGFNQNAKNPNAICWIGWPETMKQSFIREMKSELQRLITLLNMDTAIYNISCMVSTEGKAYIMECSPRSGGLCITETVEKMTGSDMIRNLVRSAVGLKIENQFTEKVNKFYITLKLYSIKEGTLRNIWLNENIRENITDMEVHKSIGDKINALESSKDVFGILQLAFNTETEVRMVMQNPNQYVKVIVE